MKRKKYFSFFLLLLLTFADVESIIKCRRNRYGFSCIIFFIRRQAEGG